MVTLLRRLVEQEVEGRREKERPESNSGLSVFLFRAFACVSM